MDMLNEVATVIDYLLQMIFFGYAVFLAMKDRYQKATFCLSMSICFLLMARL